MVSVSQRHVPTFERSWTDQMETDTDCGGPNCPSCADLLRCTERTDCESLVCQGGVCQVPTCDDGERNGETERIQIAVAIVRTPAWTTKLWVDSDCVSNKCHQGTCRARFSAVLMSVKVRRFDNHNGQSVSVSVRVSGEQPVDVALGGASYTDGVAVSEQILRNVIINDPDAIRATILTECVLKSNGVTMMEPKIESRTTKEP